MRHGFTLIEILIVILILGILMALLIPVIGPMLGFGRDTKADGVKQSVIGALTMYKNEHNVYPPGDGTGSKTLIDALTGGRKRYLDERIKPDTNGHLPNPVEERAILYYRYPGIHNKLSYDLWGKNSDGVEDGINNWE